MKKEYSHISHAAEKGKLQCVKFLFEQGADVHVDNDYALRWSAENGHLEMVKFLIEHGGIHIWE